MIFYYQTFFELMIVSPTTCITQSPVALTHVTLHWDDRLNDNEPVHQVNPGHRNYSCEHIRSIYEVSFSTNYIS